MSLAAQADEINSEFHLSVGKAGEAVGHARRAGELLMRVKRSLDHGEWLPFIETRCSFSIKTAQNYMRLAARWDELQSKCATVAHLRDALGLLVHRPYGDYELHELCKLFPPMTKREFAGLVENVKSMGLLSPITLFEGKILDGKERLRACLVAGVSPAFEEFRGADPAAFVASMNLYRGHFPRHGSRPH